MGSAVTSKTALNQESDLVCPDCSRGLVGSEKVFSCPSCSRRWPIEDGVPRFCESDEFWAEPGLTRELFKDLLAQMRSGNWKDVLRNHPSADVRRNYQFISDPNRADWHELIGLDRDSVVLDLGAGTGGISEKLSRHCGTVYAVERVLERVEFMRIRFQQEGCNNISVVRADSDSLPFRENFFDLIVLNGVLEWLPFQRKNENPRSVQLFYLQKLRRLLKPNGTLYIGIENRTNYSLFLGAPDPHISVPFVAVLPRVLASLICRMTIGDVYRPYLYSHLGYRKLLGESGYRDVEVLSALPSYNEPRSIISLHKHSIEFVDSVWVTKNRISSWVKSIMIRLDLLKYFGHSYILFARK